jgi:uncharacterized protein
MSLNQQVTVGWFEIPVSNMERAMAFYEKVFNCKLARNQMGPLDMAWFPWDDMEKGAGGTLVKHEEFYKPSTDGVLVYFSCEDLNTELSRVEGAGGKVLVPKKEISPDVGFMALFTDCEGNRIALHSRQ